MIAILDYGIGNIGSIANMLNKIGYKDICFAKTAQELSQADKIILPGSLTAGESQMKHVLGYPSQRQDAVEPLSCSHLSPFSLFLMFYTLT